MLDGIRKLVFGVNHLAVTLAGWCVMAVTVLTTYGVVMRYGFKSPVIWVYPVCAYLLCFVVFLAMAATLQNGVHVRVDYFLEIMPSRRRRLVSFLGDLASTVFLGFFSVQLWRLFIDTLERHRSDETMQFPLAIVQWVLPAGALFLLLTHLVRLAYTLAGRPLDTDPMASHVLE